jgi:hypothetical protein
MNPHHTIQLTNLYRYPITLRALFNEFLLGHRTVFINIIPLHAPRSFMGLQRSGIGRMPNNPGFQRSETERTPNSPGTLNLNQDVTYHEMLAYHGLVMFLLHVRNRPQPQKVSHPRLETLEVSAAYEKPGFWESFRFHFLPKKRLRHKKRKRPLYYET